MVSPQGDLNSIEGAKVLSEGWWQQEDGVLVLSLKNGHPVSIHFNTTVVEYDVLGQSQFFNNLSAAATVAGHETTDLFKWSKRFLEDTSVRFTWLVQPRPVEGVHAWIPYAVFGVGFVTVVSMLGILGREGLGPMANMFDQQNAPQDEEFKRSLDAKEEAE